MRFAGSRGAIGATGATGPRGVDANNRDPATTTTTTTTTATYTIPAKTKTTAASTTGTHLRLSTVSVTYTEKKLHATKMVNYQRETRALENYSRQSLAFVNSITAHVFYRYLLFIFVPVVVAF